MSGGLHNWVAGELVRSGGFTDVEAADAAAACASERRLDDTAATVAVARGTELVPERARWWLPQRKAHLFSGRPIEAYAELGRQLAGVEGEPVVPGERKRNGWQVELPGDALRGDRLLVGDGINSWARATVISTHDDLVAIVDPDSVKAPLAALHTAALEEALTVLSRP
jgi:hypothetical protein